MSTRDTLPDLLGRTSEVRGEEVIYRFANGLTIKTEVWNKDDKLRILPLGSPQGSLMNHMLHFPEVVRDKTRVRAVCRLGGARLHGAEGSVRATSTSSTSIPKPRTSSARTLELNQLSLELLPIDRSRHRDLRAGAPVRADPGQPAVHPDSGWDRGHDHLQRRDRREPVRRDPAQATRGIPGAARRGADPGLSAGQAPAAAPGRPDL